MMNFLWHHKHSYTLTRANSLHFFPCLVTFMPFFRFIHTKSIEKNVLFFCDLFHASLQEHTCFLNFHSFFHSCAPCKVYLSPFYFISFIKLKACLASPYFFFTSDHYLLLQIIQNGQGYAKECGKREERGRE